MIERLTLGQNSEAFRSALIGQRLTEFEELKIAKSFFIVLNAQPKRTIGDAQLALSR